MIIGEQNSIHNKRKGIPDVTTAVKKLYKFILSTTGLLLPLVIASRNQVGIAIVRMLGFIYPEKRQKKKPKARGLTHYWRASGGYFESRYAEDMRNSSTNINLRFRTKIMLMSICNKSVVYRHADQNLSSSTSDGMEIKNTCTKSNKYWTFYTEFVSKI